MYARVVIAAVGLTLSVCSVAKAQTSWTGYTPPTPGLVNVPGVLGGLPYTSLTGNEYVQLQCGIFGNLSPFPCPNGGTSGSMYIPISAFARSSDLAGVSDLEARFNERLEDLASASEAMEARLNERFENNLAASSSISFIAPSEGATNRLGFSATSVGDSTGVSVSYFRRIDGADIAFGAGRAGSSTAFKASVGFSW